MIRRALLALLLALLGAAVAEAHAIGAEARIVDGRVMIEAYFSDNTPARNAQVTIRNGDQTVAEGRTDDDGRCSFPAIAPGNYEVDVDAGVGHRTKIELVVPAGEAPVTSSGPSREEFTRTPWLRIGLGIVVIVLAFTVLKAVHGANGRFYSKL
jgi:nickel transport protein